MTVHSARILAIPEIRETHRNNECDSEGEPHSQRFQISGRELRKAVVFDSSVDRDRSIDRNDY
jgi:hypothetical protein